MNSEILSAVTIRIIALIFVGLYWLVNDRWAETINEYLEDLEG